MSSRTVLLAALVALSCVDDTAPTAAPCSDAACLPGESCEPKTGACRCSEGSCPAPAICDGSSRCVNLCASADCEEGESCAPTTGLCTCEETSCPAGTYCDAVDGCTTRCDGAGCPGGEECEPSTGACGCDPAACTGPLGACDPETNRCVNRCPEGCPEGESCTDPLAGDCRCDEGSCPEPQICGEAGHCVDLCLATTCGVGERCERQTGECVCTVDPDSCPAEERCDETTLRCVSRCLGVSCPAGESCGATSGACACGTAPNTCPAGEKCDAASLHCVDLCDGVACAAPGESCSPATGRCECTATPDSCAAAAPGTRCDPAARACVPVCQGVVCATPGESCDQGDGQCRCAALPADTCTAAAPATRCDAATARCIDPCAPAGCAAGESCDGASASCRCSSAPDSCTAADPTRRCDPPTLLCVDLCAGVTCAAGESCAPTSGACECTPDSCPADFGCEPVTLRCEPCLQEADAAFCLRLSLQCGTVTGLDNCGRTRTASCGACLDPTVCSADHLCLVPGAPNHDTCFGALPLAFAGDFAQTTGDTTDATDDYAGSCGGTSSRDVVYSFSLPAERAVTIKATRDASSPDLLPALYLRAPDCDGAAAGEVACAINAGGAATIARPLLGPGTFFVVVDGLAGTDGGFVLEVTLGEAVVVPPNEACAQVETLGFSGQTASATTFTGWAANDAQGSCGGGSGGDLVWRFVTGAAHQITARVTPDAASVDYRPAVFLRSGCDVPASELFCATGAAGQEALGLIADAPAGEYFVWVDGNLSSAGGFTLTVELADPAGPPANDTCAAPEPLSFTGGVATVVGSTRAATGDFSGTCGGATGADAVWSFTTTEARRVVATVTPDASSSGYSPVVFVRQAACDATGTEVACDDAGTPGSVAQASVTSAPAGTYFVWVDGWGGSSGGFVLEVRLEDPPSPPAHDDCSAPEPLTPGTPVTSATGFATDDFGDGLFSAACATSLYGPQGGKDVVYSFTPEADGLFTVTLTPLDAGFDPSLWISTPGCGSEAGCVRGTDEGYDGGFESLSIIGVAGSVYYIVVDAYASSEEGAFEIRVD